MAETGETRSVKTFLSPEWLWRYCVICGLIAVLYLNQNYVTRSEYIADRKEWSTSLAALNIAISGLNMSLELLKQSAGQLADHESRLRTLERGR